MAWSRAAVSLYRTLLLAYPAEFRHEYGSEMVRLFEDRLQSEPSLRLWLESITDVVLTAPVEHFHVLMSDVRYGARTMAKSPGFTAMALAVAALGVSATTAVFSVVNAVLLRSLPYGHPEKLVYLWSPNPNFKGVPQEMGPNVPDVYDWERLSHSFSGIAMVGQAAKNVIQDGSTTRVGAAFVTGNFFQTLEASPAMGRVLDRGDDRPGHEHVAVVSDAFWRSQLGSAPDVLGKQIQLNRQRYMVIGVMAKDFGYPFDGDIPYEHSGFRQTDIWLPAAYTNAQKTNRIHFDSAVAIARLRDSVSVAAAQAELAAIESRLQPLYPEMWRGWTAYVTPLVQTIIGPVEKMLWLLLGSVFIVLLIAISNMGNLLMARTSARAHELGIRIALGAERSRIIRQLFTESLLLSGIGGVLGIALSYAAVDVLVKLNPGDIPRFDTATVDLRVLLVAVLLSIGVGVLAGLLPATFASRRSISDSMRKDANRVAGTSSKSRSTLLVFEVALSVVLLSGAGLLVRSYLKLAAVNPGFSPTTLTFRVDLDERYNKPEMQTAFYKSLLEKLQRMRGVKYVGASNSIPLSRYESLTFAEIRGFGRLTEMVENRSITPDYRKALGTSLLRGRDFDVHDIGNLKSPVVIVNDKLAQMYFRGRDPIGGHLRIGIGDLSKSPWSTVIGILGDVRENSLEEETRPQVLQPESSGANFAIQSEIPVQKTVDEAQAALRSLDPALSLQDIYTMRERVQESNARRRFQTMLLTGFAAMAVALALIGLYALVSYTVKQRTAEIGIRLAIGSTRTRVLSLVVWQGLRLTGIGLFIGLVCAFALTRVVASWLFDVSARDPLTFLFVPLFILVVAVCACLIPAWSAMRIDPASALRHE